MANPKPLLNEFPWNPRYRISNTHNILTPALIVYPDLIAANIDRTVQLLNGDPTRWRVHIKTAKLGYTLQMFVERGVRNFKCATTLELLVACQSGATDVLLAYPVMGANARRVQEIATQFPNVRISALAENEAQLPQWRGTKIGIFVDLNSGMNRTGIEQNHSDEVLALARAIRDHGLEFRGLHFYDGHLGGMPEPERTRVAHAGYDSLMKIVAALESSGIAVPEVITAGTPGMPCSLSYAPFRSGHFTHRLSPGTVVYNDASSLVELPNDGYVPAVLVLTRVVSHPRPGIITCDAGHKTVSADVGIPTCIVVGHPELTPLSPSEEHLPISVKDGSSSPQTGETLFLLPRHICPTVNNFDAAVLVRDGQILSVESVSARGREAPLLRQTEQGVPVTR
ncbi:MAG: D-TA family PLP-dependent enzyme [Candidatus Acidiferrum sp.]|jgi:D-serine deaminase-like pyridoxal phosphate-dependent protein